jgi:predicted nucleic acid-binding protein
LLILDTNVLSELMRRNPNKAVLDWLDRQPRPLIWTTAVTIYELNHGIQSLPFGVRRTRLQAELDEVIADNIMSGDAADGTIDGRVLPFDAPAAKLTAEIMAARKRAHRQADLRDTMIAAIAISNGATLATRNTRDFDDLALTLIDP